MDDSEEQDFWTNFNYNDVKNEIENGIISSKTKLAWLMLSGLGGAVVDEDGAVALLEERVKEGDREAMWILGICYEFGLGTEQDLERAKKLYKQSSDGENEVGGLFDRHIENRRGDGYMRMDNWDGL